jgi:hypothetical protein
MPYLRKATGIRALPRGMGQAACGALTNFLCGTSAVESVMGTPCSQCNSVPSPTLAPGSTSPGAPLGYDPSTGEITDNPTGATSSNPYSVTYPDLSGNAACLALFGENTCWGPIGSVTALVLGTGLLFGIWVLGKVK